MPSAKLQEKGDNRADKDHRRGFGAFVLTVAAASPTHVHADVLTTTVGDITAKSTVSGGRGRVYRATTDVFYKGHPVAKISRTPKQLDVFHVLTGQRSRVRGRALSNVEMMAGGVVAIGSEGRGSTFLSLGVQSPATQVKLRLSAGRHKALVTERHGPLGAKSARGFRTTRALSRSVRGTRRY